MFIYLLSICITYLPIYYLAIYLYHIWWHSGKELACQCSRHRRFRFNPWVGKIPQRRKWQPTPVLLSEKLHEQKSLAGYRGPWDLSMYLSISHIYPTYLSITCLSNLLSIYITDLSSYLLSISSIGSVSLEN